MLDRRQSFRRRTLLGCRVSAGKLGVVADGPPRRARLVWIRDGAAGLALAPDLVEATPAAAPGQAVAPTRATVTTRAITMMDAAPTTSPFEARLAAITARPSNQTR